MTQLLETTLKKLSLTHIFLQQNNKPNDVGMKTTISAEKKDEMKLNGITAGHCKPTDI